VSKLLLILYTKTFFYWIKFSTERFNPLQRIGSTKNTISKASDLFNWERCIIRNSEIKSVSVTTSRVLKSRLTTGSILILKILLQENLPLNGTNGNEHKIKARLFRSPLWLTEIMSWNTNSGTWCFWLCWSTPLSWCN